MNVGRVDNKQWSAAGEFSGIIFNYDKSMRILSHRGSVNAHSVEYHCALVQCGCRLGFIASGSARNTRL